jgi:hypothetical protein
MELKKRLLRTIFVPKRAEMKGSQGRLRNEEIRKCNYSTIRITVMKSRSMRRTGRDITRERNLVGKSTNKIRSKLVITQNILQ